MSALAMIVTTAAALAKDPVHAIHCHNTNMVAPCDCGFIPSTLEQRIAIGLLQARALECRHWSGKLLVGFPGNPFAQQLSKHLSDRSHGLEMMGLKMCREYPPGEQQDVQEGSNLII